MVRWPSYCRMVVFSGKSARQQRSMLSIIICTSAYNSSSSCLPSARSTAERKTLGDSTRNRKSKRLEPHIRTSATASVSKRDTESAVAFWHTHGGGVPRSSCLPSELLALWQCPELGRKSCRKTNRGRRGSGVSVSEAFVCVCGECSTGSQGARRDRAESEGAGCGRA